MSDRETKPRRADFGIGLDLMLIALAAGFQVATPAAPVIERAYSNGVYPHIDQTIRGITQGLPFAAGDVLAIFFALALVFGSVHIVRTQFERDDTAWRWPKMAGRLLLRWAAVAALIFAWFLCAWGYGYSRVPLAQKVPVHAERVSDASVDAFADKIVDALNADVARAHAEANFAPQEVSRRLQPFWEAAIHRLGDTADFAPYPAKRTIFDRFMTASGTTGFTDPWTHEVNLASSLFPVERPAIYAHEWSHLAGFNDETEANFIAVVACRSSGDPLLRYSGNLLVWFNLPSTTKVSHPLNHPAYDDVLAIRNRYLALVQPQVQQAASATYDRYLKANHVHAGNGSYALFVRWMVGADFDARGLPLTTKEKRN